MSTPILTLEQIINQKFSNHKRSFDIHIGDYIIQRYDDHPNAWDIYHKDQAEESDPNPIFYSEDPQEILNFINNN